MIAVASGVGQHPELAADGLPGDLSREVYSILGLPIDAIDMVSVLRRIHAAACDSRPFLISTPNANFLAICQRDRAFWESLLLSDLCPPDGIALVWIARFVGVPLRARVAGSDIFDFLKTKRTGKRPLKTFLFGGSEGIGEEASRSLNSGYEGITCVGSIFPGYGALETFSRDEYFDQINASGADFLVVSLGAQKGQAWLIRNHSRIKVPVRSHLGAVINFAAGTIRRAPAALQYLGAEWLWRIKEEPHLWKRYFHDGKTLLYLIWTRGLPLAIEYRWIGLIRRWKSRDILIAQSEDVEFVTLHISGDAVADHVEKTKQFFESALEIGKSIKVDLSRTHIIDARQIGLLLMLNKRLKLRDLSLKIVDVSPRVRRVLLLNGLEFLLIGHESLAK